MNEAVLQPTARESGNQAVFIEPSYRPPSPKRESRTAALNTVSQKWATRAETSSARTNSRDPRHKLQQDLTRERQPRILGKELRGKNNRDGLLCQIFRQYWLGSPAAITSREEMQEKRTHFPPNIGGASNSANHSDLKSLTSNGNNSGNDKSHIENEDNSKKVLSVKTDKPIAFHLRNTKRDQRPARNHTRKSAPVTPTKTALSIIEHKVQLANTLTKIKITSHLHSHVENITNAHSSHYLKSVLRILPPGFDEKAACTSSIQTRKRAFFLLDLGRVIRSHAIFLSLTCGFGGADIFASGSDSGGSGGDKRVAGSAIVKVRENNIKKRLGKGVYIKPQFQVTKNPNIELLKLLIRLGVALRCNSSDDVLIASRALKEEQKERKISTTTIDNNNEMSSSFKDGNGKNVDDKKHDNIDVTEHGNHAFNHRDLEEDAVILDDVANARKPDGYFRRLLHEHRTVTLPFVQPRASQGQPSRDRYLEVAVDGVDEVKRISNTIRRISSRSLTRSFVKDWADDCHNGSTGGIISSLDQIGIKQCSFILRLSVTKMVCATATCFSLDRLVLKVHEAATKSGGNLGGASIDLSEWVKMLPHDSDEEKEKEAHTYLTKLCTCLRRVRLTLLLVNQHRIRIDLTGLPDNIKSSHATMLTHALNSIVSCDITRSELEQIRDYLVSSDDSRNDDLTLTLAEICSLENNISSSDIIYTADVSEMLVARAGALCSRIIGVKNTCDKHNTKASGNSNVECIKKKDESDVSMHYYIDDGCYGSLGSSKCSAGLTSSDCSSSCTKIASREHLPEPLYGNAPLERSVSHVALKEKIACKIEVKDTSDYVKATVWGPTCDGLDKVCQSVFLPNDLEANRDWLMFRNLGCGGFGGGLGLGTAFNGFDPPDVDYCALPGQIN